MTTSRRTGLSPRGRRARLTWPLALVFPVFFGIDAYAQGISEREHRALRPSSISARVEGGAVRLSWGEPEPRPGEVVMRYRIERMTEQGGPAMVTEVGINAFIDPAPPKGRLTYAVTALTADGRALERRTAVVVLP